MKNVHAQLSLIAGIALVCVGLSSLNAFAAEPVAPTVTALSLADAVMLVGTADLSVAAAREDAAAAAASERSANAMSKPSVSTTTYATAGDATNIVTSSVGVLPQSITIAPSNGAADQNVTVMAPIYTGGRLSGLIESARLAGVAAKLGVSSARLSAQADVTQAYAHALLTAELTDVAGAKVEAERAQVAVTQEKVDAGHLAPVDLLREQAELADAQQAQLSAANDAALAVVDLKTILAMESNATLRLTDTLDTALAMPVALPSNLTDALRLAILSRPELTAADAQTSAANASVRAAKGEYAPQVYGVGMADAMVADGGASSGFTIGVTASLPLYDAGQRRADVDAATAHIDRAKTDALKLRLSIEQEVNASWLNLQTALAQLDSAKAEVAAAAEGYRLADLRYNAGKSTTAERLDALAASTRAQGDLAEAKAAVITARGALLAGLGTDQTGS